MDTRDREITSSNKVDDIDLDNAPAVKVCFTLWTKLMRERGQDPSVAQQLGPWLKAMPEIEDVHVDKVPVPFRPIPAGEPNIVSFVCAWRHEIKWY